MDESFSAKGPLISDSFGTFFINMLEGPTERVKAFLVGAATAGLELDAVDKTKIEKTDRDFLKKFILNLSFTGGVLGIILRALLPFEDFSQ